MKTFWFVVLLHQIKSAIFYFYFFATQLYSLALFEEPKKNQVRAQPSVVPDKKEPNNEVRAQPTMSNRADHTSITHKVLSGELRAQQIKPAYNEVSREQPPV